jgi:hypothetical protein
VKNSPARGPRSAPHRRNQASSAEARETASDRFEFARRHIVQLHKLELKWSDAREALWTWKNMDEYGQLMVDRYGHRKERSAKTPEERAELKALEAAEVDAHARLLLHENDGRLL